MGKNDDFAARHAQIKKQSNAPASTGGMMTDPRKHHRPAPSTSAFTDRLGALLDIRLALGGGLAMAIALYAFSPTDASKNADTKTHVGSTDISITQRAIDMATLLESE